MDPRAPQPRHRHRAADQSVMSTNSSSIVSKRSVEKLYHPEPHFYRYFVNKFQRRAPLINRGYHLRMHVVDVLTRSFLERPSPRPKVVVNLGCGSDVLPWSCLSRYPDLCRDVVFVDVDFPPLSLAKREVVVKTPQLIGPLSNVDILPESSPVLLRSDQYVLVGCDLRDLSLLLEALLGSVQPSPDILFIAEVSITYMDTADADALIGWASSLDNSEFCLVEQILPDGPGHPFAETMIKHFEKLGTPLKSVSEYSTLEAQTGRFLRAGWKAVSSWNLWQAWADEFFFSSALRAGLDEIEPFDEWEELQLFAAHYCVLHASNNALDRPNGASSAGDPAITLPRMETGFAYREHQHSKGRRRFGAPLEAKDVLGQRLLVNLLGVGPQGRLASCDIYREVDQTPASTDLSLDSAGPGPRICHTVTDLGNAGYLLVGGRQSPSNALQDSWILQRDMSRWSRGRDLPGPLYRHAIARLGGSSLALLGGGKSTPCSISGEFFVYHPQRGWLACLAGPSRPTPVFGAILSCSGTEASSPTVFVGILAGGIGSDGLVASQVLRWRLDVSQIEHPVIAFERYPVRGPDFLLNRFGASCRQTGRHLLLVGGIVADRILQQAYDIVVYYLSESSCDLVSCVYDPRVLQGQQIPRPLLVGSSVVFLEERGEIVILGGGSTMFSFGAFWTKGIYAFVPPFNGNLPALSPPPAMAVADWEYWQSTGISRREESASCRAETEAAPVPIPVRRVKLESRAQFSEVLDDGKPIIFEGLDIGKCVSNWNLDYLTSKIGTQPVVVHEASSASMDFRAKNFRYVTKSFQDFARDVTAGGKSYLRALSALEPADKPANLEEDFPNLSGDFVLPPELSTVTERKHSEILRVSGPVEIWLHYDVMANVYCQISGCKRMTLFPPSDVAKLSFPPGSSSSSAKVSSSAPPSTSPHEATLSPGDVLFIPRLWPHTAVPTTPTSVAVNVFFRDLESGYSSGRDVYGNRDLAAYERGRQDVARIVRSFRDLPRDAGEFYMKRLAEEMLDETPERAG